MATKKTTTILIIVIIILALAGGALLYQNHLLRSAPAEPVAAEAPVEEPEDNSVVPAETADTATEIAQAQETSDSTHDKAEHQRMVEDILRQGVFNDDKQEEDFGNLDSLTELMDVLDQNPDMGDAWLAAGCPNEGEESDLASWSQFIESVGENPLTGEKVEKSEDTTKPDTKPDNQQSANTNPAPSNQTEVTPVPSQAEIEEEPPAQVAPETGNDLASAFGGGWVESGSGKGITITPEEQLEALQKLQEELANRP